MQVSHKGGKVPAHAQMHLMFRWKPGIGFPGELVQCKSRFDAALGVGKLQHQAIAQAFDNAATMQRQHVLLRFFHELLPPPYKSILVLLHDPDRLDDVHDQ